MGVESVENRLATQGAGSPSDRIENRLMAEVKTIKIPDRQNGAVELPAQLGGPVYQLQC